MHTLNRGLVEQHVAVYGRRDAHWMASWRAESLDVWTTLTLTVGQGQQDAMPYSSVHNSTAREERDDSRSSPILNGGQNRAWPTSASTPLIRSRYDTRERGRSRMKPRLLLFQRKNNYIYIHIVDRLYEIDVIVSSSILDDLFSTRLSSNILSHATGIWEAFPQKMNLIRGTRSRGLKNISRGRDACEPSWREYARQGRTGWPSLDTVCLHSATMRRSSVFHGNYRRARSSMPFVHRLISLSTYFPFLRVYKVSPHERNTIKELSMEIGGLSRDGKRKKEWFTTVDAWSYGWDEGYNFLK